MNSKEVNSYYLCPNYVQEFGLSYFTSPFAIAKGLEMRLSVSPATPFSDESLPNHTKMFELVHVVRVWTHPSRRPNGSIFTILIRLRWPPVRRAGSLGHAATESSWQGFLSLTPQNSATWVASFRIRGSLCRDFHPRGQGYGRPEQSSNRCFRAYIQSWG